MTVGEFRQEIPRIRLAIKKGTHDVPADGFYHVILDGKVVLSSPSRRVALERYRELRDERLAGHLPLHTVNAVEALQKEIAERKASAFMAESSRQRRAKATRKGGKGGSGGVGG